MLENEWAQTTVERVHFVGAVLESLAIQAFGLVGRQKSISGAPGNPTNMMKMLDFCAWHHVEAVTEHFPMSEINQAMDQLRSGQVRYRIVLESDFGA